MVEFGQESTREPEHQDEAVHQRVWTLARLTGESMTAAVDRAVSERLDRVQRAKGIQGRIATILRIGRECAALPVLDPTPVEEILYDEYGLPKRLLSIHPS